MIGNVIEIGKNNVVVKISLKEDQIKSIINYHVAFDMDGGVVIGEIVSINKDTANINLLGEIVNNKFIPGVTRKPFYASVCRVITSAELPIVVGSAVDKKSIYIGRLMQYNGYQVHTDINDLFSSHFAILGNTGSGKSHGLARIIQNLFNDPNNCPRKSNFFLFDAYGEYNQAFKNLNIDGKPSLKVYNTKITEFEDANTVIFVL